MNDVDMKNSIDEETMQARLKAEETRWQEQKINALGKLAGGIAHDFNNLLAVVMLHVDMLNLQLEADSPHRHRITEIKEVSDNAAALVRQLMAFGRKLPMKPSPTALNEVVANFLRNSGHNFENVSIETNLDENLGLCIVDAAQTAQVLQNLVAHAAEQMPDGGTVKIETANVALDDSETPIMQSGGAYIQISVSDESTGLDEESQKHIFEPFYSTQRNSKGTGLRLASVYGIVKQMGGFIWVSSEENRGTTFKVQFPRIDEPVKETSPEPEIIEQSLEIEETAGNKTILLVEDERAVRMITSEILRMSGYEVFEASNGMEALEFAQSYIKPINLLLTDVSMPLMNGREVAEKITNLHPEAIVLFMSGNITDALDSPSDTTDAKEIHFIGKPFSPDGLMDKVEEILEK